MSRNGFGYIVAVLVLGLMAFMGLFLTQSSTAEYSQAAISVYRTMARQLAEAAGEEAFAMMEERFKDKSSTGYFDQLLVQAASSQPPKNGGSTGLNPSLLDDFNNLANSVTQTLALKNYHITRAGFTIEKILPTIKCCRPIPNLALDADDARHRSPDRESTFDNEYSRDWYLVIQLDITIALKKQRTFRVDYTVSHDVKIINLAPIARNYTMFSILGHNINVSDSSAIQGVIKNEMNTPDVAGGRLILWNMPFQSRVYIHGPSIINLENPKLATDRTNYGAYTDGDPEEATPGINQAFQYNDTFYGMSYFPTVGRAIFPTKTLWDAIAVYWRQAGETKGDSDANSSIYQGLFEDDTVYGGILPSQSRSLLEALGDLATDDLQETYYTGMNVHQKFLPAGPYCRTPWKYVSEVLTSEDRYLPNSKLDKAGESTKVFPSDDEELKLEHRWSTEDSDLVNSTAIYAGTYEIKYNRLTNNVKATENLSDFSLSYYNNPDPEGFLSKLGYTFSSIGSSVWTSFKRPFQAVGMAGSALKSLIFGNDVDTGVAAEAEAKTNNLYPTNFRLNYTGAVTRVLKDETEIPRDSNGNWKLNGVYWLASCQVTNDVTYVGTGTIMVNQYNRDRPFVISGDIIAEKDSSDVPQGHLNIFYHPYESATDYTNYMLQLEGCHCIEAGVYSCFGVRTTEGNIEDLTTIGADPNTTTDKWQIDFEAVSERSNIIRGNYVNFYLNKNKQTGDLWVLHNHMSPMYFDNLGNSRYSLVQNRLDSDTDNTERKKYEKMTHEFFMSPKLMHAAMTGGNNSDDDD